MNTPSIDTSHSQEAARTAETHERFRRLRRLISDDKRRQRLLFLASLVSLLCVAALGWVASLPTILPFDLRTTRELQEVNNRFLLLFMTDVSIFGYAYWPIGTTAVGVLLVGVLLGWRDGAYLLLITVVQGLANLGIKTVIGRVRPLDTLVKVLTPTHGNSFPSGHVMYYTVFFGFLFFLAWTRLPHSIWRVLALCFTGGLVLLVGPSRIYLGAHWLSDVLAAYFLSLVILSFSIEFFLRYFAPQTPEESGGVVGQQDQVAQKQTKDARRRTNT